MKQYVLKGLLPGSSSCVLESRAGSLASPGAVTGASQVVRSGQRRILFITVLLNIYVWAGF
ncbi:hypothetical protein D7024_01460 [Desulfofundulus salinus]|uniref:Uncharacterized protein n=1 Tax=Desulfofundulus salinus TaxID=2419843 RepID=A0A494WSP2_9FIRM|nr:hypothetical protein D7024_01460 [Desulfofundulus salinum]